MALDKPKRETILKSSYGWKCPQQKPCPEMSGVFYCSEETVKKYGFKTIHRVQLAAIGAGAILAVAFLAFATSCVES